MFEEIARMLSGHDGGSTTKPQDDPEAAKRRSKSAAAGRAAVSISGPPIAGARTHNSASSASVRGALLDAFEDHS